MKKEHGSHNKQLCEKLFKEKNYYDWVVTTAFYSAIHYIDYKIFPCPAINGKIVNSIEEAWREIGKSKHATRKIMVGLNAKELDAAYSFLATTCNTARYIDYKISQEKAKLAKEYLQEIVSYCDE